MIIRGILILDVMCKIDRIFESQKSHQDVLPDQVDEWWAINLGNTKEIQI